MAVFANHPNPGTAGLSRVQQRLGSCIELADQTSHVAAVGTVALRIIIEMRQVHQCEIGVPCPQQFGRTAGNPLRAWQTSRRTPKRVEREWAELLFQSLRQTLGRAGNGKDLVTVCAVKRLGSNTEFNRGALIEPPK